MKHHRPDWRTFELGHIWQSLTIIDRNSWLRLARAVRRKRLPAKPMHIFDTSMVIASMLLFAFPFNLRYTLLAIGAGYVLAVNLAIVRVCIEGIRSR
jgi:hypothetical protein